MKPMRVIRNNGSYRRRAQERRRITRITLTSTLALVLVAVSVFLYLRMYGGVDIADAPRLQGDSMSYVMNDGEVVELRVYTGETGILALPDEMTVEETSFSSDNPDVVRVDDGGRLDALSAGTAVVHARAGSFDSVCELTVEKGSDAPLPSEITTAYSANTEIVEKNRQSGTDDLYYIVANRRTNTVTVYTYDEGHHYTYPVRAMVCSCGTGGDDITPVGKYSIYFKERWHPLYGDVYGQYVSGFSGPYLIHSVPYLTMDAGDLETEEYNDLSHNASQGCVRMSVADVKWIYDNCPMNTPVRVIDAGADHDPLGTPPSVKIDESIRWDPTDPDEHNPYREHSPAVTASDITVKKGADPDLMKGVNAVDLCGNDITDRVEIDGTVYTEKPGVYYLTYRVTDDFHLTASTTVAVTVEP